MPRVISASEAVVQHKTRPVRGVPLFIAESAVETMVQAADDDALDDLETLGLMIGRIYADDEGEYAVSDRVITSERVADSSGVRFDLEAVDGLIDALDGMEDGERIIGWYHSHLGCGCFMSDTDVRTQHALFGQGTGFAIVIDPLLGEFAAFDNSEVPEKIQMILTE